MSTQTPDQESENEKPEDSQAAEQDTTQETNKEQGAELDTQDDPEEGSESEQALEAALEQAQNAKDDLLRVQAEMQNLRRRTEQDIEKAHKYGQEKLSIELLAVMDNLERAQEAASNSEDEAIKAIREGVDLTVKGFADCFKKLISRRLTP